MNPPVLFHKLKKFHTPFLFIDEKKLVHNYQEFTQLFPNGTIYYSVKANNTPSVLKILAGLGSCYDVASWEEIKLLKKLKVAAKRMVFSSPSKIPSDISNAFGYGVDTYAFDSRLEVDKLAKLAPGSKIVARMIVDNAGSEWPLVRKFGLTIEEVLAYMPYALAKKLQPYALSFHVGSQNLQPHTWQKALERMHSIWIVLKRRGINLPVINIGGGFPVHYRKNVPAVPVIANTINGAIHKLFKDQVKLYIEPGRRMIGNTGILGATVINRAKRGHGQWLYLDTGVYHGFQETLEGFSYMVRTPKQSEKKRPFVLCGPTCDSTDVIMEEVMLPDNLTVGDRIYFLATGAYTTSYEHYNGFNYPHTVIG